MDDRLKFVARLLDGEKMAVLCREFEISRKTGYKIWSRYQHCGLKSLTDRTIEYAVDDMKWQALQHDALVIGQIVNAAPQDVVLGDDFLDVESILQALEAMNLRAGILQLLRNRLGPPDFSAATSSSSKPGMWSLSVGVSS